MDPSIFQCVRCAARPLSAAELEYRCARCGAAYSVRCGVPLFLPEVDIRPSGVRLTDDALTQLCKTAVLADDPPTRAAAREIFAWSYHLPEMSLDAENNYYFHRVGLADEYERHGPHVGNAGTSVNENIRCRIAHHHIPSSLPTGATLSWNVRLVNEGAAPISSRGERPVRIGCRWRDGSGKPVTVAAERTELPIDLLPGRGMSIPVWIDAPDCPGRYTLEVLLCRGEREWLQRSALNLSVDVIDGWDGFAPRHWQRLDRAQETYSYLEDHELGRTFLREEIERRKLKSPLILEVGGSSSPMLWDFPGQAYSVDIDVQTVQVGALRFKRTHPHMHFLAADANRLPFAAGVFDCAVLFATLHHLVDPAKCLREARRVVKPGGFVALACEPVGSYRAATLSAEFRRELEQGINEQIFTCEEYARMFWLAGLVAERAEIDRGSLRGVLRRRAVGDWIEDRKRNVLRRLKRMAKRFMRVGATTVAR